MSRQQISKVNQIKTQKIQMKKKEKDGLMTASQGIWINIAPKQQTTICLLPKEEKERNRIA